MEFFKHLHLIAASITLIASGNCVCSSNYGAKPCEIVPAPRGHVPKCAKTGQTYCEYPPHYPSQVIHHLVEKWKYNYSSFFQSELQSDYSIMMEEPKTSYSDGYYPEATYGKIVYPSNTYPVHNASHYENPNLRHPSQAHQVSSNYHANPGFQEAFFNRDGNRNFIWNKWNERVTKYKRKKRSLQATIYQKYFSNKTDRNKRQAGNKQASLCAARKQYIMPRAALNKEGNWMYIVNLPEVNNKLTQLVQSENCMSTQCSGICSLPNGYTSKCEQKYVQKRLVGLEADGNQLYTDIFWFPSCCVCTIVST